MVTVDSQAFTLSRSGREQDTDGLWVHTGVLWVKGDVRFPDGSIGTTEIATGAVQQQLGSFVAAANWTLPQSFVWTETPIQVTCTPTTAGSLLRVEWNFIVVCPTKGQRVYWTVMSDGSMVAGAALGGMDSPENNFAMMAYGCYYYTPQAIGTSRRLAIGLSGPSGTLIPNAIYSTMFVTEQKR